MLLLLLLLLLLKAERLMEAIDLYKEKTAKMEEQGGAHQKVLMTWFQLKDDLQSLNKREVY